MYCKDCGKELDFKNINNEGDIPYCAVCDKLHFPKVNLAMIAILSNQKNQVCLINQNNNFKYKVLIAGFIKPGETLEECVKREIKEEVGVDIIKCDYLNSHFYDSSDVLMVGFHAETNQLNLVIDENEVDKASWYDIDDVIGRMREGSIADLLYKQYYKSKRT